LSGTKAGGATIDPPEDESGNPSLDAIQALGAHMLVVEDLTLIHANTGYSAASSHATQLTRVTATGNVTGVTLNRSSATISGSDLSENETPLIVVNASTAIVSNSTMNDNTFDGPWAQRSSNMSLTRCSILNNPWGVQAMNHSRATVNDSAISITELNDPNFSFAGDDSTLQMSNCTHRGHILAYNSSRALLNVVDQGEPAGTDMIWLQRGSYLVVTGSSVIRGDIDVGSFCDAEIDTPDAVDGSITCSVRHSRLWINQDPTGGASGCE
jgi:hypothetical protein